MNRERAKELLPIIQAFAEGKEIQYRCNYDGFVGEWVEPTSFDNNGEYRIKPREFWITIGRDGIFTNEIKEHAYLLSGEVIHVREVLDDD